MNTQNSLTVTVDQACKLIGMGKTKMYDEIRAGNMPARKLGTRTLILRKDVEAYLEALPAAHRAAA